MSKTPQELLIPRVICIGGKEGEPNYPDSTWNTGDIISSQDVDNFEDCKDFPNCFKELKWYDLRNPEDMPKYVLASKTYGVIEVEKWEYVDGVCLAHTKTGIFHADFWEFQPASKSEWEAQQKEG